MYDASWLLGYAKTSFFHNAASIPLKTKSKSDSETLASLVRDVTPPCHLHPLLFSGHLQTIWTVYKDAGPPIYYKRHIFDSDHPIFIGTFAVDFVVPKEQGQAAEKDASLPERTTYYSSEDFSEIAKDDDRPMLVCLHGLSGGSHENYLRQVVAPITAQGWECCVITARGCGYSKVTSKYTFNARSTWDVRQTVKWLRRTFPNRRLYAIGYSMGANILTSYVGEEGARCELKAAIAVSNPWNLEICHHALYRTWFRREVYYRTLGTNLKNFYLRHKEQILRNEGVDHDKVMAGRYLPDFDREVQCPTWGYPTVGAYQRDASSVDALTNIRIPFLGISAEDDPISSSEAIPFAEFEQNPYTVLITTNWGGHLGWFAPGGKRWFADAVAAFLFKMQDDVDFGGVAADVRSNGESTFDKKGPVWDGARRRMQVPL